MSDADKQAEEIVNAWLVKSEQSNDRDVLVLQTAVAAALRDAFAAGEQRLANWRAAGWTPKIQDTQQAEIAKLKAELEAHYKEAEHYRIEASNVYLANEELQEQVAETPQADHWRRKADHFLERAKKAEAELKAAREQLARKDVEREGLARTYDKTVERLERELQAARGQRFIVTGLMINKLEQERDEARRQAEEWKHRAIGGTCRILSEGDACDCAICRRDKEIAELSKQAAEAAARQRELIAVLQQANYCGDKRCEYSVAVAKAQEILAQVKP